MLQTVKGTYENGQVTLDEPLAATRAKVIVTVIEELSVLPKPRRAGSMQGKIWMTDDFNAPLDDLKDYM